MLALLNLSTSKDNNLLPHSLDKQTATEYPSVWPLINPWIKYSRCRLPLLLCSYERGAVQIHTSFGACVLSSYHCSTPWPSWPGNQRWCRTWTCVSRASYVLLKRRWQLLTRRFRQRPRRSRHSRTLKVVCAQNFCWYYGFYDRVFLCGSRRTTSLGSMLLRTLESTNQYDSL